MSLLRWTVFERPGCWVYRRNELDWVFCAWLFCVKGLRRGCIAVLPACRQRPLRSCLNIQLFFSTQMAQHREQVRYSQKMLHTQHHYNIPFPSRSRCRPLLQSSITLTPDDTPKMRRLDVVVLRTPRVSPTQRNLFTRGANLWDFSFRRKATT